MVMTVTMFTMERWWLMVISWLEQVSLEDNSCLHNSMRMVRIRMTKNGHDKDDKEGSG